MRRPAEMAVRLEVGVGGRGGGFQRQVGAPTVISLSSRAFWAPQVTMRMRGYPSAVMLRHRLNNESGILSAANKPVHLIGERSTAAESTAELSRKS